MYTIIVCIGGKIMKVTIKDVAKEAEVAPSTVSRVLSDNPKISNETKLRVQEAIKKLKYRPNAIARSLANSKTRTLGVVLDSEAEDLFANPFFMQAMKGMSICAQSMGYYIMYAFSKKGDEELESLTDFCTSGLVDGIVLLRVVEDDKIVSFLKERDFPFVVIGRPDDEKNSMWVDNDNFSATYDVVHRLIEKGHRDIGFIGGKGQMNVSRYRLKGYKAALRDSDIAIDNDISVIGSFNMDMKSAYQDTEMMVVIHSEELNSQLRANMQRYEADAHEGVLQPNTYREMFSDDMSALSKFQRIAVWLVDPLFRFLF